MTTELQAADAYCRYLATRHYENFSVASLVLPRHLRVHLARIYAFCRVTDDLGDESGSDGLARLARWKDQVEGFFSGESPVHPVLVALADTVKRYELPAQPFVDLIAANVQDQTVTAYPTWESLLSYCAWSAAPVGRMVLQVFEVEDARALRLSDDVCVGLQLANFAQDVSVDRAKGRTYLVGSDLAGGGPEVAIRAMCRRAAELLDSGRELESMVQGRLRVQLSLYRLGGEAILEAIAKQGYKTAERRPTLSVITKLRLVAAAARGAAGGTAHAAAQHAA